METQKQTPAAVQQNENAPMLCMDPDILYQQLMHSIRKYHPSSDLSMIEKAYRVAQEAHEGQKRKSGEPYIIHPLYVGIILAELTLDKETIAAALLHDIVEDTDFTIGEITREFDEEVALLVDGVTKLGQVSYAHDKMDVQAENLRKMFLAMAKDIRVILIKLADRLHNMRTLQYMSPEKQIEKARETMDIYAPIAHRLGISKIKTELDDLALKYIQPEVYKSLEENLANTREERQQFMDSVIREVRGHIDASGIKAEVDGRVKHFFSIYKKMRTQDRTLDQIYDLFAVRIKVDTVKDCYAALGVIHELYKPVPGRFKDYIAMPKENMYQSLHTTLIGSSGTPFEIQIRTFDMHRTAEYGIAAHWKYKESGSVINNEEKLSWLRQILEWQQDMSDNREFLNLVKTDLDLFTAQVYCFTPQGDVKTLPAGSTTIDFAYRIHSAVGNKMVGARVNGRQVPIDYELQNGDRVEIITSQNSSGPSRDWLSIVKSSQAKTKINQWFKTEFKEENILKGRELLDRYCKAKGITLSDYLKPEYQKKCMQKYGLKNWDSVLAAVGHGGLKEGQVVNKLSEEYKKDHRAQIDEEALLQTENKAAGVRQLSHDHGKSGITVKGVHDVSVRFSKCCSPVPGDEIVGFVTRGRGVSIHRSDCINMLRLPESDRARIIDAEWEVDAVEKSGELYMTEICLYAHNRTGILLDISKIFMELKVDIKSVLTRTSKQGLATISLSFPISGIEELNRIIKKLRTVESVIDIERNAG